MARLPFRTFRDQRLSVFQAAAAAASRRPGGPMPPLERAAAMVAARQAEGVPLQADTPPGIAHESWTCARLGWKLLQAELGRDPARRAQIEDRLDNSRCDPRWATTLLSYLQFFGRDGHRRTIPYIRPEAAGPAVIAIPDQARIALLSDWGTGRRTALTVLDDLARQRPDIVIHLGDIYYAGTPAECAANFQQPMDRALDRANREIPVFTLSGNHDMYGGGAGYYGLIDGLNPGAFRQPASFFCLRATHWQLVALDTGLHAYDPFDTHPLTSLEPAEQEWAVARIAEFPGRTILLSHHPLFTARGTIGDGATPWNANLLASFQSMNAAGRVAAWFWGHEHRLALYKPFLGLPAGRCIGCGAIPMFVADEPDSRPDGPALLPPRLGHDGTVFDHAFALLTLDGAALGAEYWAVGAQPGLLHTERLG